jgi:hypothetical protein
LPEKRPETITATPYPADRNIKMLLACAWLTINSSSTSGKIGANTILIVKLVNQINQRNKRNKRPLPLRLEYRAISSI